MHFIVTDQCLLGTRKVCEEGQRGTEGEITKKHEGI